MKKSVIIDGNSILNRAFFAIMGNNSLMTKDGTYTNAIFGFLNIYYMIMDKLKPDYISVTFDLRAPTFRHKMYDQYKAQRKPMAEELRMQLPLIKDVLRAMNISIHEMEGFEADDLLGTMANKNSQNGIETYILTGDRDAYQLISDNTFVIMPTIKMGKTEYIIYDKTLLKEKLNIAPEEVIEVKALMGDASDNIPGVAGIGEKTAYSLVANYHNIDYVFNNIDDLENIRPSAKDKLKEGKDIAYLSKELATINITVPGFYEEYDIALDTVKEPDLKDLYTVFKLLEFKKFMSKYDFSTIDGVIGGEDKPKIDFNIPHSILSTFDDFKYLIDTNDKCIYHLNLEKEFFSMYLPKENKIYFIDLELPFTNQALIYLSENKIIKMGYSIKKDIKYIFDLGATVANNFNYDLEIAYYLLDSSRTNYKFEDISLDLFNIELTDDSKIRVQISLFDTLGSYNKLDDEQLISFSKKYLIVIEQSYPIVLENLKKKKQFELFEKIEMPLETVLADMEHTGVLIDMNELELFEKEMNEKITIMEKRIYELAGIEFNINSPQQLGNILFERLGIKSVKNNKRGYATDKEVLEQIEDQHEIVPYLLEYRQHMKLKSTYVDGIKQVIQKDGRVHTTFTQTVTTTGRLSSVEPNLQNIPVRQEIGKNIRKFFVASNGTTIVDSDYSQIELRVLAHMAKDQVMIDAFNNGQDIHRVTASQVFNTPFEDVTDQMRSKAKAVNFGIVYGISEYGLGKNLGISRKEAKEYIENYLEKYNGINKFMDEIVDKAKEDGYVETLFGRRRYIPELKSSNYMVVQFGKRAAMNSPIQGTAADIIKLAMIDIYNKFIEYGLKSKIILQVHDELLVETIEEELDRVKEIMKSSMENVIKLEVPLIADFGVGHSWFNAK